ncbi:hypothetical protein L227DRAFT_404181 [Lentinus tigrinus ALCF2SS1-6]|uniref:Uncharacterized protein n=1 Tax=Lentinus tigrinus ALCF2SS1-6 TaxID=1328759 RepID=A0A5C2RST8_9APHY|nr:hypothetical protein L227DRAFT_404181 [Lentinus tigrinus ALCF2SS1-6]
MNTSGSFCWLAVFIGSRGRGNEKGEVSGQVGRETRWMAHHSSRERDRERGESGDKRQHAASMMLPPSYLLAFSIPCLPLKKDDEVIRLGVGSATAVQGTLRVGSSLSHWPNSESNGLWSRNVEFTNHVYGGDEDPDCKTSSRRTSSSTLWIAMMICSTRQGTMLRPSNLPTTTLASKLRAVDVCPCQPMISVHHASWSMPSRDSVHFVEG